LSSHPINSIILNSGKNIEITMNPTMTPRKTINNGSISDITLQLKKDVTVDEVNATLRSAAETTLQGIMAYTEEPIVSSDIIGNPNSAIIDGALTLVLGGTGNLVKVFSWYDNEWGYSSRLADLMNFMSSKEP